MSQVSVCSTDLQAAEVSLDRCASLHQTTPKEGRRSSWSLSTTC